MVLLSERPEFNEKIHAASLMAPSGYMSNANWGLRLLTLGRPILEVSNELFELFSIKRLLRDLQNILLESISAVQKCGNSPAKNGDRFHLNL